MNHKSSYSQNSQYINCPQMWSWSYQHKLRPEVENASLYFGSAVDASVMSMLEGKEDYLYKFKDLWKTAFQYGKRTPIYDNDKIVYSNNDFDEYVLKDKDKDQLLLWAAELNVGEGPDGVKIFKEIAKIKKNPYQRTSKEQMQFFSRASWLSMKRKGEILVESFKEQFLPRIEQVIATQAYAKHVNPHTGDIISGYIDMVLKIKGEDKPVIFDLKTAAQPYTQDQIDLTEQLTLYAAMSMNTYNTDRVGYIVLCKNIPKESESYCSVCGHKKKGKFKNCNAKTKVFTVGKTESEVIRCSGKWVEKKILKPEVQVLIETKTSTQVHDLMQSYDNIALAMKNNIIYKNTSRCNNHFGGQCPYYKACHKNDFTGLKKG